MTSEQRPGRRVFALEELSSLVPGLGTIMPEIGNRTWKLYYAAKAGNWPLASFQLSEIRGLMGRASFTRPRYEGDLRTYMDEHLAPLLDAVKAQDFAAFDAAFKSAVESANSWHDYYEKPYIVWKLPDSPPPDLDMTPREKE
jgi:hypothetical protein